MSRIGKNPIAIPEKTTVTVAPNAVVVKGPLGELSRKTNPLVTIAVADGKVTVTPVNNLPETRALWGTYASHIKNMLAGVQKQYEKKLIVEGVGYKAAVSGNDVTLSVGFSHPIKVSIPAGLKVTSEKGAVLVTGIDKELVGTFAAKIRGMRKPEPYKGKGIRYEGEVIRRKQGKKTA